MATAGHPSDKHLLLSIMPTLGVFKDDSKRSQRFHSGSQLQLTELWPSLEVSLRRIPTGKPHEGMPSTWVVTAPDGLTMWKSTGE